MWLLALPYVFLVIIWFTKYKIWFLQGNQRPEKSIPSAVLKCFPVLYLVVLISYVGTVDPAHRYYRDKMFWGLVFSMGGDFCLTWFKKLFIPGVLSFGTAHVFYIMAFGLEPKGPLVAAVPFAMVFIVMVPMILPNLQGPVMKAAVGVYVAIICMMGWRAMALYNVRSDLNSYVGLWGAIIFMMSDTFIALSSWVVPGRIPRGVLIIMVTYYLGQALLASSVLLPVWDSLSRRKYIGV